VRRPRRNGASGCAAARAHVFADTTFTRSKQAGATLARVLRGMLAATLIAFVVLIVAARSDASPNDAHRIEDGGAIVRVALQAP
jgi:hypothetical protein